MRILVTGSAGHLGEALMRTFQATGSSAVGLDVNASPHTDIVGSIVDRNVVRRAIAGCDVVLHTATLHKPHVATHSRQAFVDTNITGTLNLLEEAVAAGAGTFVFTSTTSVYGRAMNPPAGAPAVWVTEDLVPQPKNIYGVTKLAAENLCELFHHRFKLACLVLRTSRFFPEQDDDPGRRALHADANIKANEFLYRRADIEDIVSAHRAAIDRAAAIGFGRYIISATTPFLRSDCAKLRHDAPALVRHYVRDYADEYERRGWSLPPGIERVYDNAKAREELGWQPRYDFARIVDILKSGDDFRSPLAQAIGSKGYHDEVFADGPYPTE
ncbi:MAG TPA: NAD(P)-dependent oxidoreductase [Rudaea sp.]|nr:NAD(P)-dependent oxidoreductase [Rudaea sp.]